MSCEADLCREARRAGRLDNVLFALGLALAFPYTCVLLLRLVWDRGRA